MTASMNILFCPRAFTRGDHKKNRFEPAFLELFEMNYFLSSLAFLPLQQLLASFLSQDDL